MIEIIITNRQFWGKDDLFTGKTASGLVFYSIYFTDTTILYKGFNRILGIAGRKTRKKDKKQTLSNALMAQIG